MHVAYVYVRVKSINCDPRWAEMEEFIQLPHEIWALPINLRFVA
jgi:hypothetical protein